MSSSSSNSTNNDSLSQIVPILSYIIAHCEGDNRPYLEVSVFGVELMALLDSGSNITILGAQGWKIVRDLGVKLLPSVMEACTVANNESCNILGVVSLPIKLQNRVVTVNVFVVPSLPHVLILGVDFWVRVGLVPDLRGSCWRFSNSCPQVATMSAVVARDLLTVDQREKLACLTEKYFSLLGDKIGCTSLVEHKIVTTGDAIRLRPYRYSPAIQKHLDEEIQEMLKNDIIEPSESPWSFPALLVPKGDNKWRFCVDYRALNKVTKKDAYPIPFIDTILDKLRHATYLSSLDVRSAYWNVAVEKGSREKTAFCVPGRGLYQFKRMPFGLTNSPATWQRLVDRLLGAEMEPYAFVYLDDIIVVTSTFEKHLEILEEIFKRLLSAGLTLSREKCQFCRHELKYLGYVVDKRGLHVDPDKVAAILNIKPPGNTTEVRRVIGMASWYRRFIPQFSTIISPLTALLKKNKKWEWTDECDLSFQQIKDALSSAPVLTRPDFSKPFVVQTDASGYGIGAVLSQEHEDGEHVICYISRSLTKAEKNYSTTERELLAVIFACEKLRPYLEGFSFKVITDHYSLVWLHSLREPAGRLARWAVRLQQFDFEVVHRKGKEHIIPDVLSRSVPEVALVDVPKENPLSDRWYCGMCEKIQKNPLRYPQWRCHNQTLYKYVNRSYPGLRDEADYWKEVVPKSKRQKVIEENHDHITAGHGGVYKTYERLRGRFYWPMMRADVARYVRRCKKCLENKPVLKPPAGLMGDHHSISKPWTKISVDLFGPLPRSSQGYRFVLVVLDTFSKFPLFFPIRTATAAMVTKIIEEQVILVFGCPQYLVCDNGVQFRSGLFTKLCEAYKVHIIYTPAYHAQANPVERMNAVLKTMLQCYIEDNHKNWDRLVPKVACAIRSSVHEVTGFTPYFVNFSREYIGAGDLHAQPDFATKTSEDLMLRSQELKNVYKDVEKRLALAHHKAKQRYDLRRRPVSYSVGEKVYRRNYVLSDASKDFTAKLAPKFLGPFIVKRKHSPVMYDLVDEQNRPKGTWHVKDLKAKPPDSETDSD